MRWNVTHLVLDEKLLEDLHGAPHRPSRRPACGIRARSPLRGSATRLGGSSRDRTTRAAASDLQDGQQAPWIVKINAPFNRPVFAAGRITSELAQGVSHLDMDAPKSRLSLSRMIRTPGTSCALGSSLIGSHRSVPGTRPCAQIVIGREKHVAERSYQDGHPCLPALVDDQQQRDGDAKKDANFDVPDDGREEREEHETQIDPRAHPPVKQHVVRRLR